ncbi:MAG: hypothetical protein PF693_17640 [Spirochaetia bacterium]|jgi:methyl-accepting chemotaxis protein|nr:hypothetical protein [Spirochaetia bacterium]
MQECELIESCPFYNDQLKGDAKQIESMKEKYCRTNNLNCARYMVFIALGKESMPEELFPHQKDRAYELIIQN